MRVVNSDRCSLWSGLISPERCATKAYASIRQQCTRCVSNTCGITSTKVCVTRIQYITGWNDNPVKIFSAAIPDLEHSRHTQTWLQKERKLLLTCRGTSSMRAMDLELILVSTWRHRTFKIHWVLIGFRSCTLLDSTSAIHFRWICDEMRLHP